MAPYKCCVGGCDATSSNYRLFCMPLNVNLRKLWLSLLVPTNPNLLGLTENQLLKKRVCERHFDQTQFDKAGVRIRYSYPCLFTEMEIAQGIPLVKGWYFMDDHSYCQGYEQESDNSIGKPVTMAGNIFDMHRYSLPSTSYSEVISQPQEIETFKMVYLSQEEIGQCKEKHVMKYTWITETGFSVSVISYGAIIQAIKVPDKHGNVADVVLGFDDFEGYVTKNVPYFGATVGRCANRIGDASFEIDGVTYNLAKNIGQDHLHGGLIGFDKVNWDSVVEGNKVVFSYLSKDGEEGYPGNLLTNVIYEVKDDTLFVQFISTTTKKTVVNLTNHSYFNLAGHAAGARELYDHVISINADKITETTEGSIPTGRFIKVGGTLYDLRIPTRLGDMMDKDPKLYDDNFCITNYEKKLNFVSRVFHPYSGRFLEVYSDQPGVQLYTSDGLPSPTEAALIGKDGAGYRRHGAFCLETQNYPDAIHHHNFPTPILSPGEVYTHNVTYKFGVVKERNSPEVIIS